jgi:carbon-monoxide dehydrogenase large subunit
MVSPTPLRESGVKGAAEGGTLGPAPVMANAISDALGVEMLELPLTPQAVRRAATQRLAS